MNRHSGWLAAGLLLFAVLACNLSKNKNNSNDSNNSNSNSNNRNSNTVTTNRPPNAEVYVDTLNMAKDNDGKAGDAATTFAPSDSKIHCVINLNKAKGGTKIKTVWIAADVEGTKNQELKTLDYTTNSFEKKITGYLTWKGDWPKGQYRLEVYINGALDKTIDYTIE
jgi:hypothetical protein